MKTSGEKLVDRAANIHCRLIRRCPTLTGPEAVSAACALVFFQGGDPIRRSPGPGTWAAYMAQHDDHQDTAVRFVRLPLP